MIPVIKNTIAPTKAKVRASVKPAWATPTLNWSVSLFTGSWKVENSSSQVQKGPIKGKKADIEQESTCMEMLTYKRQRK